MNVRTFKQCFQERPKQPGIHAKSRQYLRFVVDETPTAARTLATVGAAEALAAHDALVFNLAYTLSVAGMRTRIEETGGRVVDYTYDILYRLTSETIAGDGYGVNGTMDLVGNRTDRTSTVVAPLERSLVNFRLSSVDP